jgi:DNA-binding transcriptional MocR family regulator
MPAEQPIRAEAIAAQFAGAIADGRLAPGLRLPSRRELATAHGAALRTVQAALAALAADGLVETAGPGGTRVAAQPPNRQRLGLAFTPILEGRAPWSRFYAALHAVAAGERCADGGLGASPKRLPPGAGPPPGLEPWPALAAAARGHRLLGVLFTGRPRALLAELEGAPAVAIDDDRADAPLPRIQLDNQALIDLAVARLCATGCRRPAALVPPDPAHRLARRFHAACRAAGLPARPSSRWTARRPAGGR